jgi:DNA invertase Pin-like site-specific DNA recombinase
MAKGLLVGYLRHSTDDEITGQIEVLSQHCKKTGFALFHVFVDSRPDQQGFRDALACVSANLADGLIINDLDQEDLANLQISLVRRDLELRGKRFVAVAWQDEQNEEPTKHAITGGVLTFDRDTRFRMCEEGRRRKRAAGGWMGGRPPYGFKPAERGLDPVPAEQEIIKRVKQLAAEGKRCSEIANLLNAEGVPTKRNAVWRPAMINRIVKGPGQRELSGLRTNGVPYGYKARERCLVPVPEEQAILVRIREMAAKGISFAKIANLLNAEGVPTKHRGRWRPASFYSLIEGQRAGLVYLGLEQRGASL